MVRASANDDIFAGHALNGHVIASSEEKRRVDCAFNCLDNPGCKSYNYKDQATPDQHNCKLSDASKESHPADLASSDFDYYGAGGGVSI